MQNRRISIITAGLLTVIMAFCSFSCAEDQAQALINTPGQGNLETVENLLSSGVDVNSKGEEGFNRPDFGLSWRSHRSCESPSC